MPRSSAPDPHSALPSERPWGGAAGPALRLVAALGIVLALAGLAAGLLAYRSVDATYGTLVRSRAEVVVRDIAMNVEGRLTLGLPLTGAGDIQDVLERERARDSHILSLEVFEESGALLYSTDRGLIGEQVEADWLRLAAAGEPSWNTQDFEAMVIGVPLRNSFSRLVGGVVLRYSSAVLSQRRQAYREAIAGIVLAASGLVVLGLYAAAALAMRPRQEAFQAARGLVLAALRDTTSPVRLPDDPLAGEVAGFCRHSVRELRALHAAMAEIERLDESG